MVPPTMPSSFFWSGSSLMNACAVAGSNSVLLASRRPSTLRAYSMTAIWKPRQMPRKGSLVVRACSTQRILPSTPRWPKPPGTMMPSMSFRVAATLAVLSSALVSSQCSSTAAFR